MGIFCIHGRLTASCAAGDRGRLPAAVARDLAFVIFAAAYSAPASAQSSSDPDARARATEARMTDAERFQILHGIMPINDGRLKVNVPPHVKPSAGYIPGIPRLGVPDLLETDASLGVINPLGARPGDTATALPSGLSLAAGFDPALAERAGQMIGTEARAKGFNVLLAGGVNLTRDWYGGRNFEYLGEDPLLAGVIAGSTIHGVQAAGTLSTIKHYALNAQETQRRYLDARIGEPALRESDLLAFQIAIERGQPASVMCAYNLVNAVYSCGNAWLLNTVLKKDWGFRGWVMSDWGTTYDVKWFNAGLDQQSGENLDTQVLFDAPLKTEVAAGRVSRARLSDAVRRILRSIYAVAADRPAPIPVVNAEEHAKLAREFAAAGMVLLKNDGVLPLAGSARRILVVGGFADKGVVSGGGSSNVTPTGGAAGTIPLGGPGFLSAWGRMMLHPSPPLLALRQALPGAQIEFDNGYYGETAAARAAKADLVIVFAQQWLSEGLDSSTLDLPWGQDKLIAQVAAANPNTVVVLETGNPVAMPWLGSVRAVLEAWYPGQRGGEAIADILTGRISPSGRLPMTFPRSREQAPRPQIPGLGLTDRTRVQASYVEGADVGYRWYARRKEMPLFAFGHGLSYARFEHGPLTVKAGAKINATFTVRNVSERSGSDVPQIYVLLPGANTTQRLAGFAKIALTPGESRQVTVSIDPRLLASWRDGWWTVAGGQYRFAIGDSAMNLGPATTVTIRSRRLR